jgi:hypothetical protein
MLPINSLSASLNFPISNVSEILAGEPLLKQEQLAKA